MQQRAKLFKHDYFQCLEAIETCTKVDHTVGCLKEALTLLSDGGDYSSILKALRKSPRFAKALANKDNHKFEEPLPKLVGDKRKASEKSVGE
jgi:hypothetical protein